ncbi:MAG: type II toxin-antitoxin system RelE family toxin [Acidobacteriota bacterium]|jgi:mRNA-degrading endonuclease RelE of RelBE toxin-antitoxin system
MAKRIAFTDQAKAELRAIPQPIAIQILRTLARFLESEEGNVRRLQGVDPPLYRLRTQDHRVFFRDLGSDLIEVTRVRNRREAYR